MTDEQQKLSGRNTELAKPPGNGVLRVLSLGTGSKTTSSSSASAFAGRRPGEGGSSWLLLHLCLLPSSAKGFGG